MPKDVSSLGAHGDLSQHLEQTNHQKNARTADNTSHEFSPEKWEKWRENKGLSTNLMPGSITWLVLDGITHAGQCTIGLRTEPGQNGMYVVRHPPVDAMAWARENIEDDGQRENFRDALEIWYPGRKKGEPARVPYKTWGQFIKRIRLTDDDGWTARPGLTSQISEVWHPSTFWKLALLDAIVADTQLLRASQAYWCGRRTIFGVFSEGDNAGVTASRWRCQSWTCAHCSRYLQTQKGRLLSAQLEAAKGAGAEPLFMTLTLDPSKIRREHPGLSENHYEALSWRLIRQYFKTFIRALRRRCNAPTDGPMEYALRVEAHKSGWAHLHVVIINPVLAAMVSAHERKKPANNPTKQGLITLATSHGFGRIFDIQRVKNATDMGMYAAKAATRSKAGVVVGMEMTKAKQLRSAMIPRNFRTMETSRGWKRLCGRLGWSEPGLPSNGRSYLSVGLCNHPPQDFLSAIATADGDFREEVTVYMAPDLSLAWNGGDQRTDLENICRRYLAADEDPPPIPL